VAGFSSGGHSDGKLARPSRRVPPGVTIDRVQAGASYTRYYSLFTASGWAFLEPAIQHDWLAPFRETLDSSGPGLGGPRYLGHEQRRSASGRLARSYTNVDAEPGCL
jgi:hypothetical protein